MDGNWNAIFKAAAFFIVVSILGVIAVVAAIAFLIGKAM